MGSNETPGLKWRKRKGGQVPYWFAPAADVQAGYPVKSANLSVLVNDPRGLAARCQRLQAELLQWRHNRITGAAQRGYDGTWGSLIDIYFDDPDSPYQGWKPGTKHPYLIYGRKLKDMIGDVRVAATDGVMVRRWFGVWADQDPNNRKVFYKLPAGRMTLTVLKSVNSFGVQKRPSNQDCVTFKTILGELEFPVPKSRKPAPTAAEIERAMEAAWAVGANGRALCYALQFETTLRQYDVTGIWLDLSDPRPSDILAYGRKWVGLTWKHIDDAMILKVVHGKTEDTTGKQSGYDLNECPLVLKAIDRIPVERRTGALVTNERHGLPYRYDAFKAGWKADFAAAGLPAGYWNRDLRAGGNTEASIGGANKEDRAKISGHSPRVSAKVYDRDTLEAHRRVARMRRAARNGSSTD